MDIPLITPLNVTVKDFAVAVFVLGVITMLPNVPYAAVTAWLTAVTSGAAGRLVTGTLTGVENPAADTLPVIARFQVPAVPPVVVPPVPAATHCINGLSV